MLRILIEIFIFVSGYSPLFILFVIKNFYNSNYFSCLNFVFLFSSIFPLIILFYLLTKIKVEFQINVTDVSYKSFDLLNYTLPYLVAFMNIDINKPVELTVFLFFLMILCFLSIKTQIVFINPILAVLGYRLYDVKFNTRGKPKNRIILSRYSIEQDNYYYVSVLSEYMLITHRRIQ